MATLRTMRASPGAVSKLIAGSTPSRRGDHHQQALAAHGEAFEQLAVLFVEAGAEAPVTGDEIVHWSSLLQCGETGFM
ncbi:MAG: hypothetical protein U1F24_04065 [Alphaproteobacteria bacterium]